MADRVILCIGSKKGLFVADSPSPRRRFTLRGPFGAGVAVYSALIDRRGTTRIYASSCNAFFGMKVLRSTWRSENGGGSWKQLAEGLPKKESYFTVLRDAMDIDDLKSPALYFGTTTGQLWIGRDGGERWECLFDSLPPIHCVKAAVV